MALAVVCIMIDNHICILLNEFNNWFSKLLYRLVVFWYMEVKLFEYDKQQEIF